MTKTFRMSSEKKINIITFTFNGVNLALRLAKFLDANIFVPERFKNSFESENLKIIDTSLTEWAGKYFFESRALIFISACGVAVRAISKYVTSKLKDPAVLVIDESAKFVIPVLSGHIGGANELARKIAAFINSLSKNFCIPVITTATDINNIIAVDEWAVKNNCVIENPENIKKISGSLLENKKIGVAVSELTQITPFPVTLFLRPKNLILGAGCKKNIDPDLFENSALKFLENSGVSYLSLKILASIDIKKHEPAMINFARKYKIDFVTFSAETSMPLYPRILTALKLSAVSSNAISFKRLPIFLNASPIRSPRSALTSVPTAS